MGRKFLKMISLALACFLGLSLFISCQGMGDIAPKEYGEWEGNYIYLGNGRCKTTGEDFEQLVKTVESEGITYTVSKCLSSQNKGNKTYMVLECVYEQETIFCLVKYDIDEQKQTVLHHTCLYTITENGRETTYQYQPQNIEGIYETYMLLKGYRILDGARFVVWYTVDFEGSILRSETESFENWTKLPNGYWIYKKQIKTDSNTVSDYEIYCKKDPFSESILVYTYRGDLYFYSDWQYVNENGVQGILIEYRSRQYEEEYSKLENLYFFAFSTNTLQTIVNLGGFAELYDVRYLKTYDYRQVTYKFKWNESRSAKVETGNVLYQIVYEETGARLEKIDTFQDDRTIGFYGKNGNELLYYEIWFSDWRGCDYGGSEVAYYKKNIATGERVQVEREEILRLEDDFSAVYEREKGVTVGKYTYFIHEEEVSHGFMSSNYIAYMLKRYDSETGKIEVMQFWSEDWNDSSTETYGKYCKELWFGELNKRNEALFNFYSFRVA